MHLRKIIRRLRHCLLLGLYKTWTYIISPITYVSLKNQKIENEVIMKIGMNVAVSI
jgi:hypothetical protein